MKSALRKKLREKREELENKDKLSRCIEEKFLETDIYKNSEAILLYYSVGAEVSTHRILSKALQDKKKIAFPVCLDSCGTMEFYYISDASELEDGMYGIKAPSRICTRFERCNNSVCVVPGIAFDKSGFRIGYGKGYYDRFLENFEGISVGFCFAEMLEEALPTDRYDKKVNYLITDKKIYNL